MSPVVAYISFDLTAPMETDNLCFCSWQ